jgi:molybdate transport system substrate-binding protein
LLAHRRQRHHRGEADGAAGIAEQLKDKTKLVDGFLVAEVVARGEAEIGMQQINVIVPVAGADYVGPLGL